MGSAGRISQCGKDGVCNGKRDETDKKEGHITLGVGCVRGVDGD